MRHFAAEPVESEKIWRFGKTVGDPELKPIDKVAVKFYLYSPENDDGTRDYSFEQRLSKIEQWFGQPGWCQLTTDFAPLQHEALRKMVSLLAATMYLRNPTQLDNAKDLHKQVVAFFDQLPELPDTIEQSGRVLKIDYSDWNDFRNADEEDVKRYWIDRVAAPRSLAEKFKAMRWSVVFSDAPVFITTDNPVVFIHPTLAFHGLNDPDVSVLFPLSPTRILVMDHKHGEPDGQYYRLKASPASYNVALWRNAIEHMFSHRDPDLVLAEFASAR